MQLQIARVLELLPGYLNRVCKRPSQPTLYNNVTNSVMRRLDHTIINQTLFVRACCEGGHWGDTLGMLLSPLTRSPLGRMIRVAAWSNALNQGV